MTDTPLPPTTPTSTATLTPELTAIATSTVTPIPTPTPMLTATDTPGPPTIPKTPTPDMTATAASATIEAALSTTPTSTLLSVRVKVPLLNIRSGPGLNYTIVDSVSQNTELVVSGQAYNCQWFQVYYRDSDLGWVSGSEQYVIFDGNCADIPAINILVTPTANLELFELIEPLDGESVQGVQVFTWQTNIQLSPGQAFEAVIWQEGGDPIRNGMGITPPTTEQQVTVNFKQLLELEKVQPGEYRWGVVLVKTESYKRLRALAKGNRIFLNPSTNNNTDGPAVIRP